MRWLSINNGRLLQRAADAGFDVFLTADQNLPHQQNLLKLPIAVVVMRASSNRIESLLPLVPEILATLAVLQPRTLQYVPRP